MPPNPVLIIKAPMLGMGKFRSPVKLTLSSSLQLSDVCFVAGKELPKRGDPNIVLSTPNSRILIIRTPK